MKNKKLLLGLAALVIAAVVLMMIYRTFAPRPVAGEKTITVEITHGDQSTKTVVLRTAAEHLGVALREQEGLVSGEEGAYGLYIRTVDGETASDEDRTWWCITRDGEELPTSADSTVIADGEQYGLSLLTY